MGTTTAFAGIARIPACAAFGTLVYVETTVREAGHGAVVPPGRPVRVFRGIYFLRSLAILMLRCDGSCRLLPNKAPTHHRVLAGRP